MKERSLRFLGKLNDGQSGKPFQQGFPSRTVKVDCNFRVSRHLFDTDHTPCPESVVVYGHSNYDFALIILLSERGCRGCVVGSRTVCGSARIRLCVGYRTTAYAPETCPGIDLRGVVVRTGRVAWFVGGMGIGPCGSPIRCISIRSALKRILRIL